MTSLTMRAAETSPYFRAGLGVVLTMAMTSLHHVYGAIVYETPYRLHIVFVEVPFALVAVLLLWIAYERRGTSLGRTIAWIVGSAILIFPVAMIGVYEGGFNHTLRDFVYFVLGEDLARGLCGAAASCQSPDSFIFEATGIAQFFVAIPAAVWAFQLLRLETR